MAIGQDLLNVPMGEMIRQMAFAIADAQFELDESSMHVAEMMSGRRVLRDEEGNPLDITGKPILPAVATSTTTPPDTSDTSESETSPAPAVVDTRVYFGYDLVPGPNSDPTAPTFIKQPALVSMLELGFTPVFYQFIETVIEVKIAIKITQETSFSQTTKRTGHAVSIGSRHRRGWLRGGLGAEVSTTQVDATYSSKYSYSAEGSSLLRTKLVPVPPPPVLEERIRALLEQNKTEQTNTAKKEALPAGLTTQ